MNILGISCLYHDAAACLVKDGKVVAATEEERFTRKKHDNSFPTNAIKYCLEQGKISIEDINYVVFYEKPIMKFDRILNSHLETFPKSFWTFFKTMPSWLNEKLRLPSIIKKEIGYDGEILFVDHHLAHAASAFLVSPFKKAAILTVDGVGEWTTTAWGYGDGNKITLLKEIHFPNSLGLLYSAVTTYLGFKANNDEYKIMGLASYGKPTYLDKFEKIVDVKKDGSYQLDMDYFVYHYRLSMPSKKFIEEFGPARKPKSPIDQRHKDIAASLQTILEEILFKILNHLHKKVKCNNLCMAGGVALNSTANGKIVKNTKFKKIFVQPAASDAGGSLGAAFYVYNTILGKKRDCIMDHVFLGPEFSTDEIRHYLKRNKINFKEFKNENRLIKKTAKLILENNITAWFQGRLEWGPRALGNRSILANPCNPDMKDIVNKKVKHREEFRPFAPSILLEDQKKYFETGECLPFMQFTHLIKEKMQNKIPSVTHVNGTGRLQSVTKDQNPKYYKLIKEFKRLSKVPVVLNTSFNIKGEPIVCTPEDAYRCMMGTGIDYLIMDRFLIARKDNLRDAWDSSEISKRFAPKANVTFA